MVNGDDDAARFAWESLAHTLIYAARHLDAMAFDLVQIDNGMKWGYAWDLGPFEIWDAIGVPESVERMKAEGRKISVLTAYDYPTARLLDEAGVEGILVGDSMAMVVQGHENTLPVTLSEMIYHAEMVGRAVKRARYLALLPYSDAHE